MPQNMGVHPTSRFAVDQQVSVDTQPQVAPTVKYGGLQKKQPMLMRAAAGKMFDSGEHFLAKEGKSTSDAIPVLVSEPLPVKDVWSPTTVNAPRPSRLAVSSSTFA